MIHAHACRRNRTRRDDNATLTEAGSMPRKNERASSLKRARASGNSRGKKRRAAR